MSSDPTPMLRYRDVTVRYNEHAKPAIDGFDLDVRRGERVALVGPSGAGKSTIIQLAGGLVLPSSGTVEVFGVDTRALGRRVHRDTRRRIASIHQDLALVGPLRSAQNVAAGRLGRWTTIEALRSLVRPRDIDEISEALTKVGIPEKLWERTDQLSGGQQQRVAIARALFQEPDLLLADEPVSALDPARSASVMSVLAPPASNGETPHRTMVASMHDAPLALGCCDRVVGLRGGRIEFDLPPDEVDEETLRDLYVLEET